MKIVVTAATSHRLVDRIAKVIKQLDNHIKQKYETFDNEVIVYKSVWDDYFSRSWFARLFIAIPKIAKPQEPWVKWEKEVVAELAKTWLAMTDPDVMVKEIPNQLYNDLRYWEKHFKDKVK